MNKTTSRPSVGSRESLSRAAARLGLEDLELTGLESSASVSFRYGAARVFRSWSRKPTRKENEACLADWLRARADSILAGVETADVAFADSRQGEGDSSFRPTLVLAAQPKEATFEATFEVFRKALLVLGVPLVDFKATWDHEANWARLRMRLPSRAIVERVCRAQGEPHRNLSALAHWLRMRAKNVRRGVEGPALDEVFAGSVIPSLGGF